MGNLKARIEQALGEVTLMKAFREGAKNIRVHEVGNALEVVIEGGRAVALEKGIPSHQMVNLEGSTVPIETPGGTIFRKVTRLSLMMGKFTRKGVQERGQVRGAINQAMSGLMEAAVESKDELGSQSIPRVRDILGVR